MGSNVIEQVQVGAYHMLARSADGPIFVFILFYSISICEKLASSLLSTDSSSKKKGKKKLIIIIGRCNLIITMTDRIRAISSEKQNLNELKCQLVTYSCLFLFFIFFCFAFQVIRIKF